MFVGATVHRVEAGKCVARIIQEVPRDEETGKNINGKARINIGTASHFTEHSEDKYFEGTWHTAENCDVATNFIDEEDRG